MGVECRYARGERLFQRGYAIGKALQGLNVHPKGQIQQADFQPELGLLGAAQLAFQCGQCV